MLEGEHLRIARRLLDKIDDGGERFVRVVQQDVLLADGVEDVLGGLQGRWTRRGERRVFQVGPVQQVIEAHQPHEVEGTPQPEDVFVGEAEMIAQRGEDPVVHPLLDLQAHGGAAAEVAQLLLDFFQQVFRLLLVDVEVAVARDPEGMRPVDAIAGKELAGAKLDDLAEENVALRAVPGGLDVDQPGQHARDGQDGHEALHVRRLRVVKRHDDVEGLVAELGKWMELVDRQRREHGVDLLAEVGLHPVELGLAELVGGLEMDVLVRQRRHQLPVPAAILVLDQRGHDRVDAPQLLARAEAVNARLRDAAVDLLDEAGHPDFEELVEVGTDDRQEIHPFEEGIVFALRLLEHPAVERQPREFPVEISHLGRPPGRLGGGQRRILRNGSRGRSGLVRSGGTRAHAGKSGRRREKR